MTPSQTKAVEIGAVVGGAILLILMMRHASPAISSNATSSPLVSGGATNGSGVAGIGNFPPVIGSGLPPLPAWPNISVPPYTDNLASLLAGIQSPPTTPGSCCNQNPAITYTATLPPSPIEPQFSQTVPTSVIPAYPPDIVQNPQVSWGVGPIADNNAPTTSNLFGVF